MHTPDLGHVPREVRSSLFTTQFQCEDVCVRWGFMVIFWNFSGVPFVSSFLSTLCLPIMCLQSYVYSVVYMASHDPAKYHFSIPGYILIYSVLLTAYYIWDCSMSQKSRFKMQTQGITKFRKTFPQLPGCIVENPTYIQTAHG